MGEFLLVPAYPGSPGSFAVKRLLYVCVYVHVCVCVCGRYKALADAVALSVVSR